MTGGGESGGAPAVDDGGPGANGGGGGDAPPPLEPLPEVPAAADIESLVPPVSIPSVVSGPAIHP